MADKSLFLKDEFIAARAELQALSQHHEFNEHNVQEFERIARTGKVYA